MKTLISILLLASIGCKTNNKLSQTDNNKEFVPQYASGQRTFIYKTKGDYKNLVPVMLSENKTEILSYPDPSDIKTESGYPLPVTLHKGYLLDVRGIGSDVGFLKMTYEEYSRLQKAPTLQELFTLLVDKDPLTELCDCGNKTAFTDITSQLNQMIDDNTLRTTCKTIK